LRIIKGYVYIITILDEDEDERKFLFGPNVNGSPTAREKYERLETNRLTPFRDMWDPKLGIAYRQLSTERTALRITAINFAKLHLAIAETDIDIGSLKRDQDRFVIVKYGLNEETEFIGPNGYLSYYRKDQFELALRKIKNLNRDSLAASLATLSLRLLPLCPPRPEEPPSP